MSEKLITCEVIPSLLRIVSNVPHIPVFFQARLYDNPATEDWHGTTVHFRVVGSLASEHSGRSTSYEFARGEPRARSITFERPTGIPRVTFQAQMLNLLEDPQVLVSKSYHRFVRAAIGEVLPPGVHLRDVCMIALLSRGYTLVHSAALSKDGKGVVLLGPANTGKSLTTILGIERGIGYLAEDVAATDGDHVFAFPSTPSFAHGVKGVKAKNKIDQFKLKLVTLSHTGLPFLKYLLPFPEPDIGCLARPVEIVPKAKVSAIVFLQRGRTRFESLCKDEAFRRALILNKTEFSYSTNKLLYAYSFLNTEMDIPRLEAEEHRLLRNLVDNAPCYLACSERPEQFIDIVNDNLW